MYKIISFFPSKLSFIRFMLTGSVACNFTKNLLNKFVFVFQIPFSTADFGYTYANSFITHNVI